MSIRKQYDTDLEALKAALVEMGSNSAEAVEAALEALCTADAEAAQKIDKVLNGHSPVYYCNWMDIASHTPEYNYTKTWHYLNIDEGQTLETMPRNPKGDVLTAVTTLVAELKAGGLAPEAETEKLKMLIHLVGDMHCPMHTGRLSDIGGNQRPVLMFGRITNLHSAWD